MKKGLRYVDRYGLGPGVFPKAEAPKPPLHCFCICRVTPKIDIPPNIKPRERPGAERAYLRSLPAKEARDVAGSWEKRRRVLEDGETLETIYNEGKDELYKWKRMGEVVDNQAMPAFIRSNTVQQAEQEACRLGVKRVDYQSYLDIANDVNDAIAKLPRMGILPPDRIQVDAVQFIQWAQLYGFDPDDMQAAFLLNSLTGESRLFINPSSTYWADKAAYAKHQHQTGYWATDHPDHAIWHELGHVMHYQNSPVAYQAHRVLSPSDRGIAGKVSGYAQDGVREFIAETFAALALGRTLPSDVLNLYQVLGGILP